jgi:hypothetical protein
MSKLERLWTGEFEGDLYCFLLFCPVPNLTPNTETALKVIRKEKQQFLACSIRQE